MIHQDLTSFGFTRPNLELHWLHFINSSYVFFGTLRLQVVKPTIVHINHVAIHVQDMYDEQNLSIQIASKHICKTLFCHSGKVKAIAILVSRYCAGRIRGTFKPPTEEKEAVEDSVPYFDPESPRICERYILVDAAVCNDEDTIMVKEIFGSLGEKRSLLKAQNVAPGVATSSSNGNFLGNMPENDFSILIRDIGLFSSDDEDLPSHTFNHDRNICSRNIHSTSQSPEFLYRAPHLNIGDRQPLSNIHHQEIVDLPDRECCSVQRVVGIADHRFPTNFAQQHAKTMSVVRVVQLPSNSQSSVVSYSNTNGAASHDRVLVRPTTSMQSTCFTNQSKIGDVSFLTQADMQSRNSNQSFILINRVPVANMASPSRCRVLCAEQTVQDCENVIHIIDDDDDDSQAKLAKKPKMDLLLNYPRDHPNAISIHYADVKYLKPNEMLNDTIIEFYLKYILMELVPPERRSSIFIFSPFFYSRLTQISSAISTVARSAAAREKWIAGNYKRVRTWTKNVDIFGVDYIVVPIIEDSHWYLAIITFPRHAIVNSLSEKAASCSKEDNKQAKLQRGSIIVLDSLTGKCDGKRHELSLIFKMTCRRLTVPVLKEYLVCEFNDKRKAKHGETTRFMKEKMEKIVPAPVPQQKNCTDCGLFLLKFAECFLLRPPKFIAQKDSFQRWYPHFTIKGMRENILMKLKLACGEEAWQAFEDFSAAQYPNTYLHAADPREEFSSSPSPSSGHHHIRSLSVGDRETDMHETVERRRSTPPEFLC
ncbi:unnamed protein product [Thelazia callipaeda]|uniref:ULP_PROTEASE domain-containing protein n=1 Tax=Thelazia callipaeda TaxID=103827 RepID=A0A0N5D5Y2_THECL|nr:unnamed protein product [Thelazia callipaeda]